MSWQDTEIPILSLDASMALESRGQRSEYLQIPISHREDIGHAKT